MSHQMRKIPKLSPNSSRVPVLSPKKTKLAVGMQVCISGEREGILRYYGETQFADGLWCGVELFDNSGKNDGAVQGVRYFSCSENRGVFAAAHKVSTMDSAESSTTTDSHNSSNDETYHKCPTYSSAIPDLSGSGCNLPSLVSPNSQNIPSTAGAILNRTFDKFDSMSVESDHHSNANGTFNLAEADEVGSAAATNVGSIESLPPPLNLTYNHDSSIAGDASNEMYEIADVTYDTAAAHNVTFVQPVSNSNDSMASTTSGVVVAEHCINVGNRIADIQANTDTSVGNSSSVLCLSGLDLSFGLSTNPHVQQATDVGTPSNMSNTSVDNSSSVLCLSGVDLSFRLSTNPHVQQSELRPATDFGSPSNISRKAISHDTRLVSTPVNNKLTPSLTGQSQGLAMAASTPGGGFDEIGFDEEAMAKDMAIVLAALEEGKEAAIAGSRLTHAQSDIFEEPEPFNTWDSSKDGNMMSPVQQHPSTDVQSATFDEPPVAEAAADGTYNTTQTLHSVPEVVLNNTQTLASDTFSAEPQDGHRDTSDNLDSTHTIESQANTTQTEAAPTDCQPDEGDGDMMKMSVDDSTASKGDNSSMAVSTDSVVIVEEMPLDDTHSVSAVESSPPTNSSHASSTPSDRRSETSLSTNQSPQHSATTNKMQVEEPAREKKLKEKVKPAKAAAPGKSVGGTSKPSRITKPRESLLPSAFSKPKEKEKSPGKSDPPAKQIQKSKPKSKWANISKQIEKNAKSPKPAPKPIQSKLSAADSELTSSIPAATLRRPQRTSSMSSDISQSSQASANTIADSAGAKKPLKRHTLLPPSNVGQKQEFKKPRASLLPPPSTAVKNVGAKAKGKVPIEPKLKTQKIASASANSNAAGPSAPSSSRLPPDVVSSNTPVSKAKSAANKEAAKGDKNSATVVYELQAKVEELLKVVEEKNKYASGLKEELKSACGGVEGLGVVVQHLSQLLDVNQQQLVRSKEESMQLSVTQSQQLLSYQHDTELLTKNHEEEKRAVIAQLTEEREKERLRHAQEYERVREEMVRVNKEEIGKLSGEHRKEKKTLTKQIEALKLECSSWRVRYDEATDALHKDMDHRLQVALQPYKNLPQEIESLKTVIELKAAEMRALRQESNVYKQKAETIPDLEKKLCDTEQKLENLQALLDIVSAKERETAEKYHKITRKAVQEKKENHRLSLNVEALELKLEEAEFTNSVHMDSPSELDISSASLPPYSIENPDTSPSQFTRSFSRSSMKRRSHRDNINNNTALEIPEVERQISPAKHLVFRSPSSSPSPTRVSSPRKSQSTGSPVTTPYHRSSTLPRSYRTNKHQRCNSDSGGQH